MLIKKELPVEKVDFYVCDIFVSSEFSFIFYSITPLGFFLFYKFSSTQDGNDFDGP